MWLELILTAALAGPAAAGNCFLPLAQPLPAHPMNGSAVAKMRKYFKANLNVHDTGAIVASPGECPALMACCKECNGGYWYDWTRDGAIGISALQRLAKSKLASLGGSDEITEDYARATVKAYVRWVSGRKRAGENLYLEPKWNITTGRPYHGNWCRPQTDGPGLRAMALMHHWWGVEPGLADARRLHGDGHDGTAGLNEDAKTIWNVIRSDLDWVAHKGIHVETCDLWEETKAKDLLWNRMTMRAALLRGHHMASKIDPTRAQLYLKAAQVHLGNPEEHHLANHTASQKDGGFLTECRAVGESKGCKMKKKHIDGSVILSLVHGAHPGTALEATQLLSAATRTTSAVVARTVRRYNEAFCATYLINRKDSAAGVPGILYGRYAKDGYGGGNPWVLITASLATVFYRGAHDVQQGHTLNAEEVREWQEALNWSGFTGSSKDFVAAGDAVLTRLAHHAQPDAWHLYEQIHKESGKQYNARDLTWSYAEVLLALVERQEVVTALEQEEGERSPGNWWV